MDKFKDWISESSQADVAFQHRASAFLVYGPIQKLYDASTAYGDGYAREVVYQNQLPIYAQLGLCGSRKYPYPPPPTEGNGNSGGWGCHRRRNFRKVGGGERMLF